MEMSFAKQLKESGIFKGMVLPGGFDPALKSRSYLRMEAWSPAWIFPQSLCTVTWLSSHEHVCCVQQLRMCTLVGHQ